MAYFPYLCAMNHSSVARKPKRILFLMSRFLDGGIDTVLVEYLRHLSMHPEYQLTLAIGTAMGSLEVFSDRVPENVEVCHLVKADWLTKWRQRKIKGGLPLPAKIYDELLLSPLRRIIMGRRLRQLAAKHDVVIDFDCCFYSFLKSVRVRKIAWFHFSFEQSLKQNRRRTLRIGRQLEHYDKVVTIAQSMCEEGRRLFPQLADKLCVIYNAKDREVLLQRAQEKTDDQRIDTPYILAIERLEESQKDLSTLLRAYRLLREKYGHQERLYLLGKGHSEQQLRQLAVELGIGNDVVFLGFTNNPYPWLAGCKALAHSAKFEGLPTVLVEGLMLDRLIVATDCPTGPREILGDGKAGLLVPVADAEAMAEALHRILTDEALQARLQEGIEEQRRAFSFEAIGKQFDELLV